jgi:hypothetical protein
VLLCLHSSAELTYLAGGSFSCTGAAVFSDTERFVLSDLDARFIELAQPASLKSKLYGLGSELALMILGTMMGLYYCWHVIKSFAEDLAASAGVPAACEIGSKVSGTD